MKIIISYVIIFCWSLLLVSAEECLDPATSNPTAILATVKLFKNIRPAEGTNVFMERTRYKRECDEHFKLGKIISIKRLSDNIVNKYFTASKIIVTTNDGVTYGIDKDAVSVNYIQPLGSSSYNGSTCVGIYKANTNTAVVEYENITIGTNRRMMQEKTDPEAYVFSDVRVYTLSESPAMQYALLGDDNHFLAVHLKEPYDVTSNYINTRYNDMISFGENDGSRGDMSAREFLRMYGTFPEMAFTQMRDHCQIMVFRENFKAERDRLEERIAYLMSFLTIVIVIICFFAICVTFCCVLYFWTLKRLWTRERTQMSVADGAECQYEYVTCVHRPKSSAHAYDKVTRRKSNCKKREISGYLSPIDSMCDLDNKKLISSPLVENHI